MNYIDEAGEEDEDDDFDYEEGEAEGRMSPSHFEVINGSHHTR